MKNQCRGKSIYVYPVLLIVLAILINGCAEVVCDALNPLCLGTRHISTISVYDTVISPHEFSSLEVNIELKDNIHPDVTGEDNPDRFRPEKFRLIDYKLALIQALIDSNYNGDALYSNIIEIG